MKDEKRQDIALFRYGILAPLISGTLEENMSNKEFYSRAAKKVYTNPDGTEVTISETTLKRWYNKYRKDGFEGLIPQMRIDSGCSRKLDEDMMEQIKYLKKEYPRLPATLIHQKLFENGTIRKGEISLSTITRYINQLKLENKYSTNKEMRRYERAHINEVWYADSSTGLYLTVKGKKKKLWIIAAIDDASRMVVGIDIFFNDNYVNVMSVFKSAVAKYGRPKIWSLDNGSPYKNKQMTLLAARLGIVLNYNPPYTPVGKAKIERWFSTLKLAWMSGLNMNDFSSLDEVRDSLLAYVQVYNKKIHSSLNGKSPMDRFFEDALLIKRVPEEQIEKCFLLEIERRVSADNVITINNIEYEVDYRYSKKRIILRYSPDLKTIFLVDPHSGELEPIKLLNKQDNAHIKRQKVSLTGGAS